MANIRLLQRVMRGDDHVSGRHGHELATLAKEGLVERIPGAAEVPTVAESGGPAIESATWVAFLAPAGTPREIVTRISSEAAKAVNLPEIRSRFEQSGIEPVGTAPEHYAQVLRTDTAKWRQMILEAGIKAD